MKTRLTHLLPLSFTLLASLPAQSTPPAEAPETSAPAAPNPAPEPGTPSVERGRLRRGNFNPADIQERMMSSLREQMDVKDDAEWALITERITAVTELRRPQITGAIGAMFGGRGGNGGNRAGFAASPEQDALRSALADHLPDAEITARLAKLREVRKQNETKLDQARENLRAVLTVRQEAVAVMVGLLN
jgi:hypothetical protein